MERGGRSAGASGFVVGGVVADLASWRLVFWAYLPLAAALAAAMCGLFPVTVARGGPDR